MVIVRVPLALVLVDRAGQNRPCFAQEKGLIRSQIAGPYRDDTIFPRGFNGSTVPVL